MNRRLGSILSWATIAIALAAPVLAQPSQSQSRCADCHYANPNSPRQDHLQEWDRSPHSRNNVGCEKCHGGNSAEFEPFLAHRDMLNSSNKASKVNRRNLPTTCGACHVGPFVAFQDSRHYQQLQSGDDKGPTCSTCHGDTDGRLLSPKALASQCNQCHGPGEQAPRAERARQVRDQYESLGVVRQQMKLAQSLVKRVTDKKRRAELDEALNQAQVPLTRAVNAGHKFVYDELREYLGVAQQRIEALLNKLANR